jgi:glycosyltransferase involved in cell wall biosynthesis
MLETGCIERKLMIPSEVPASFPPSADSITETEITGVNLVSAISGLAVGGTAAYLRSLGEALLSKGIQVQGIARSEKNLAINTQYEAAEENQVLPGSFPTAIVSAAPLMRVPASRLGTLFGRTVSVKAGATAAAHIFGPPLHKAAIPKSKVFHFVGNGWEALGFGAIVAARRRDGVVVVTPFVHPNSWGDGPIDIELYNQVDLVLAASQGEINHLISCGVNPERLRQIDLAPANLQEGDEKRFRAKYQIGERPLILFIARKQEYKGYHTLRRALWKVKESVPDVCLAAIGPDDNEGAPPPPVPEGSFVDLGTKTLTPGDIQDKADALAASDVFCMPSVAEAFGIVYVEAWAYGTPVVGGPAPAVRELVQDGVAGFCVTEQNEDQVADHLIRLLSDRELRNRLGEAGRRLVQERYNWETVSAEHLRLYGEALENRRKQR